MMLHVSDDILALGIPAMAIAFEGLTQNDATGVDAVVDNAIADIAGQDPGAVDEHPYLRGFRSLHARIGVRSRDVAAPEALRRMLLKRGDIPRIGPLVDLYNALSLRTGLALGAHALDAIEGGVALRLTDGTERFVPLGTSADVKVRAGEYAYVDDAGDVLCRLEVRQGNKTKVVASTTACLLIVQGNPATGIQPVRQALLELQELVPRCLGGQPLSTVDAAP